jgi:hypothetical protein
MPVGGRRTGVSALLLWLAEDGAGVDGVTVKEGGGGEAFAACL